MQYVLWRCVSYESIHVDEVPGSHLLLHGNTGLPEYMVGDLLLHKNGVDDDHIKCCRDCLADLKKNKLPSTSIANSFQVGECPSVLSELRLPEKILIRLYRPKMYVTTLRSVAGPQSAQRGLKGNTISFPQDIVGISNKLPASTDVLADTMKVVFIGSKRPSRELLKKIFSVRLRFVRAALEFLSPNHPSYSNVNIDPESLAALPEDDIPDVLWNTITYHEDSDEDSQEHSGYIPVHNDIDDDTVVMESAGMVDLDGNSVVSDTQLKSAVQNLQGAMFVPHGAVPATDYHNPLLWIGAYPCLFPYGSGGPEIERKSSISLKRYIKHLLMHADPRFRLELSFKFHVFNVLQKREVSLRSSLMLTHTNFADASSKINNVTHETLVKLCDTVAGKTSCDDDNVKALLEKLTSVGSKIQGSAYARKVHRREIHGLMVYFGMPAFWISICPTDIHSPILLVLAGEEIDYDILGNLDKFSSPSKRAEIAAKDPVAASLYFNLVIDAFNEFLLGYGKEHGGLLGHVSTYSGAVEEQGRGTLHIHMLVWLHGYTSRSELESQFQDNEFKKKLLQYLEGIIHEGYLNPDTDFNNLNVSKVSFARPVNPADPEYDSKFSDDVDKLVTVANTHRHTFTCYKYGKHGDCRLHESGQADSGKF